jgi:hypothetical protein
MAQVVQSVIGTTDDTAAPTAIAAVPHTLIIPPPR